MKQTRQGPMCGSVRWTRGKSFAATSTDSLLEYDFGPGTGCILRKSIRRITTTNQSTMRSNLGSPRAANACTLPYSGFLFSQFQPAQRFRGCPAPDRTSKPLLPCFCHPCAMSNVGRVTFPSRSCHRPRLSLTIPNLVSTWLHPAYAF